MIFRNRRVLYSLPCSWKHHLIITWQTKPGGHKSQILPNKIRLRLIVSHELHVFSIFKINLSRKFFRETDSRLLPMLFQLIGRILRFNLHEDSRFENVCDYDDCRYSYYWFLITYQWPQRNLQKNNWTMHWWVYRKTHIYRWTGFLWANWINSAQSSEINWVIPWRISTYNVSYNIKHD